MDPKLHLNIISMASQEGGIQFRVLVEVLAQCLYSEPCRKAKRDHRPSLEDGVNNLMELERRLLQINSGELGLLQL